VDEHALLAREQLTATLFAFADIRQDVREIRDWLKEKDDGQGQEDEP
jgi:hypothetical protein